MRLLPSTDLLKGLEGSDFGLLTSRHLHLMGEVRLLHFVVDNVHSRGSVEPDKSCLGILLPALAHPPESTLGHEERTGDKNNDEAKRKSPSQLCNIRRQAVMNTYMY
jgi:hypothetical protein